MHVHNYYNFKLKILPRFDWSLHYDVFIEQVKMFATEIISFSCRQEVHNADIRQDPHWQDNHP